MTFGLTEGEQLLVAEVITHNIIILANPKTESCVCPWLRAQAMFDVTCFPAFIGELDVILTVLPTCLERSNWRRNARICS